MLLRIKLWLLRKAFDWCYPDLCRNMDCGILEDFEMELISLDTFCSLGITE